MPALAPHCSVVTRAIDIIAAARFRVLAMPIKHIDRDEYEVTIAELADRRESHDGVAVVITGNHEDHGRTTLRREAGVITLEADSLMPIMATA